jgi:hypothetical protein
MTPATRNARRAIDAVAAWYEDDLPTHRSLSNVAMHYLDNPYRDEIHELNTSLAAVVGAARQAVDDMMSAHVGVRELQAFARRAKARVDNEVTRRDIGLDALDAYIAERRHMTENLTRLRRNALARAMNEARLDCGLVRGRDSLGRTIWE